MISIFYETFEVGRIDVSEQGPSFVYDARWQETADAFPISLTMPLDQSEFGPEIITPWLVNLLPEEQALITMGRNLGISPQDTIGLLERIGNDVAGALSIGLSRIRDDPDYRLIDNFDDLERVINELPAKPFLAGEEGVSMSLAGAQEKIPVALVGGQLAIPLNGASSTHILKSDNERLLGSVQNEALCLVLANRCGLEAAKITTGKAGDRSYILVERYDRSERNGRIFRIHQEDFCQALGKVPASKYERNQSGMKGPTLPDFFGLVNDHMTAAEITRLLDAVIFNVLICNTDSHSKNYSLLLTRDTPRIAPLYDIMCAAAWEGVTRNLPQTIGGKNKGDHIYERHWRRMAETCSLNPTMTLQRVEMLADRILNELVSACEEVTAMPAGSHTMIPHFSNAIQQRCQTIKNNLGGTK